VYPDLITLTLPIVGQFTITSFGALMALAFLTGYTVIRLELKRHDKDPNLAADILLGALIGGILGAKLYYMLLYWDRTAADPIRAILARGGLVWYGGFIGGFLGVVYVLTRRKVSVAFGADLCAPALALAYAVGRIGCFLVGDDYGRPTESWVGIAFPRGIPPTTAGNMRELGASVEAGLPDDALLTVHPTQLYETGLSLVIFFILWKLRHRPAQAGWLFAVWLTLAGAERLFVEVFRAKDDRFFGPFTLAQVLSVILIGVGVYLVRRLAASKPAPAKTAAASG
jgi:phosphatidylglycerol:prolipoprotein diacylglycerol transferase